MTGGTLPHGADAVVMVEEVDETNGRAVLRHRPRRGENVHPPGMDLTRGQHVLSQGMRIGAAEVGLLATVGCAQVPVFKRPAVAVLATGDELVEPHQAPPPGSVRDSNRYALMAAVEETGARVSWHGHALDDETALEQAMRDGLAAVLGTQPDLQVAGEAGDGFEALDRVRELQPDVMLLDLEMPGLDGVGVLQQLRAGGKSLIDAAVYRGRQVGLPEKELLVGKIADPLSRGGVVGRTVHERMVNRLLDQIFVVREALNGFE